MACAAWWKGHGEQVAGKQLLRRLGRTEAGTRSLRLWPPGVGTVGWVGACYFAAACRADAGS